MNYKEQIQDNVIKEFDNFKTSILAMSKEDIFYRHYEIHVKTELREVLLEEEFTDEQYEILSRNADNILEELYEEFITDEYASVDSYAYTQEFIINYCENIKENN